MATGLCVGLASPAHAEPPEVSQTTAGATGLTLAEAVTRGHAKNPDVRVLAARVALAEANVRILLARVLPNASLVGTYVRHDNAVTQGGVTVVPADELGLSGSATVSLFNPRGLGDYLVADQQLDAQLAELSWSGDTLAQTVIALYIDAALAAAVRDLAAEATERRDAFFAAAERRLAAGQTDRAEVQRARLSLLEAQASLRAAEADRRVAAAALAVVLDLPLDTELALTGPLGPSAAAEGRLGEEAEAPTTRGDLLGARLRIEADETARRWGWLAFLPDLALSGSFTQGPDSFRNPDGFAWQVELRATLVLYDGGARYGVLDRAAANLELDTLALETLEDDTRLEVRAASLRVDALADQLLLAGEAVQIAVAYRQDVVRKLDAGLATTLDVLDAEQQLLTAEVRQRTAEHALALARWRLVQAHGELGATLNLSGDEDRHGR